MIVLRVIEPGQNLLISLSSLMIECSYLKVAERPVSLANDRSGKEWNLIPEQKWLTRLVPGCLFLLTQ
jgi:hypothetical protein